MKNKEKSEVPVFDLTLNWLDWILEKGWRVSISVAIVIIMGFCSIPVFKWLEKYDPPTKEMEPLAFIFFLAYVFLFAGLIIIIFGLIGNKLEKTKKIE